MDEEDRTELRAAHTDNRAIASVAIAGVVAICGELARSGEIDEAALSRVTEFMLGSLERSGATELLQAQLHQAISHQFSALVEQLRRPDTEP